MFAILAAILAAILDLKKYIYLGKLQDIFDYNLKYCLLINSVMCVDKFLSNIFFTNRSKL